MGLHRTLGYADTHVVHSLSYADATARNSATPFSADIGRVARQEDTGTFWLLKDISPLTWMEVTDTPSAAAPVGLVLTAGAGLTGGGDLSTNRTFDVGANADGSITVNANDIQVGILATDTQHGSRGGGSLHATAVAGDADGFLSASDKAKLDGIADGATAVAMASVVSPNVDNTAAVVGASGNAARQDHTHRVNAALVAAIQPVGTAAAAGTAVELARGDHVHAHGDQTSGSLHAVATDAVNGFMSSADKTAFDAQLPTSGEKSALAGSYGTPGSANKFVTQTDPLFLPPGQTVDVGVSGCAFSSVAAAVASITDASSTKPYMVRVFPGVYTESPFSMKPYVHVRGVGGWYDVVLKTNDNSNHFITGAAGSQLSYCAVEGPTGAGYAALNFEGTGYSPWMLYHVVIRKGYYGVYLHPATYGTVHAHEVVNQYAGSQINKFMYVTNGNLTAISCSFMSGPSGAVVTGWHIDGSGATATLDVCAFRGAGSTDGLLVNNGATVRTAASTFSAGTNAIHLGANGSGTKASCSGCTIADAFTRDVWVESSSSTINFDGSAHKDKVIPYVATGSTASIALSDDTAGSPGRVVLGELWLGPNQFPLSTFAQAYTTTGVYQGGGLERVSGLQVKVLAGSGFIVTGSGVFQTVSWVDTTYTLPANTPLIYVVVDEVGDVGDMTSAPDLNTRIVLGVAYTGASSVLALSSTQVDIPQPAARSYHYATQAIGVICYTGGTVAKHASPSVQLDITGGEFYAHDVEKVFTGATVASWTFWYRNGSGGWTTVASQSSVDTAHYDNNSGTLQALTSGKYVRHTLYATVSGSGTEFHVVCGQEQFDTSIAAITNPVPPALFLDDACRLAALVALKDATDLTVVDQRPRTPSMAAPSTGVTKHGDLTYLNLDDHPQYQLRTEKGFASGYCGLDAGAKVDSGNLSLASAAPPQITVGGAAVGSSSNLARQDHGHDVSVGSPSTVGTANNAGAATSLARSDHVHAHGAQSTDTLHALAVASTSHGFMSKTDKAKLDAVPAGSDTHLQFNDGGTLAGSANLTYDKTAAAVKVGPAVLLTNNPLAVAGNVNDFAQFNMQNLNAGSSASTDVVATADNGSNDVHYVDLGINSSTYADPAYTATGPNDTYLYASDDNLVVGTYGTGKKVRFNVGGGMEADVRAEVDSSGVNVAAGHSFRTAGVVLNPQRVVRVAATSPVSISTGGTPIIDGVQLALNDRVLLTAQSTASENGIYPVTAGAWSRAPDWATGLVLPECEVLVSEGAIQAHQIYKLATQGTITIGTTALTFTAMGPALVGPSAVQVQSAAAGTNSTYARADHQHSILTDTAVGNPPGSSNTLGNSVNLARADHTHALAAFGSTTGTFCEGNDARLSDLRTASGIKTATTTVAVSSATAPAAGQLLTATSSTAATWQDPVTHALTNSFVSATGNATTTSATDALMTSMTLTPGVGTYLVLFNTVLTTSSAGATITCSVYNAGVQVADSARGFILSATSATMAVDAHIMTRVTVANAGDAVEIRWRRSAGTATAQQKTFMLLKLSA